MKRFILLLNLLMICGGLKAQGIFTVVYTTSDDGFLNVRSEPSNKGKILTTLPMAFHGLGDGMLVEKGDQWSKVKVNGKTGWVYNKYLGTQTWYTGKGRHKLISNRDNMPLYGDDYSGENKKPVLFTVDKGVILADDYTEEGGYYILWTAHDNLFIRKKDVLVK